MEKELWKGNEAIAEAALRAGCDCYFGYPITPQSEVPEYMSAHMPKLGKVLSRQRVSLQPSTWSTAQAAPVCAP